MASSSDQTPPLEVRRLSSDDDVGRALASELLSEMLDPAAEGPYLLGVPTGSTPLPLFRALVGRSAALDRNEARRLSDRLVLVVMDDFVSIETGDNVDQADPWSAPTFVERELLSPLMDALGGSARRAVPILFPAVGKVSVLRDDVLRMGGIASQIVATDPFEGHVAQNYAGEPFARNESDKLADLSPMFLQHHPWAEGKYRGITFDLLDFALMVGRHPRGRFDLIITGEAKRGTLERFLAMQRYEPSLPLSFLWLFTGRSRLWTDLAA